ncbi:TRAP transporter substrate-binding protein DctP [Desulfatirhabdium butyrativorans]|uniref:TRAP transporter substrate-binding protein DctP n=1 Tax=Desulfatirhabdium butyrativorans TaxID=340467 RepID=UPI00047FC188|nr:TRAP transporter substrate-binding protein DctP [Desulfatirhabdium butyrativorans]
MKKACCFIIVLAFVFSFSVNLHAADKKVVTWKMQASYPLGSTVMMHGIEWAKFIEQLTDGRLKVEILPPGAMCAVQDIVTYLEKGVFDCAISYGGFYTGLIPETDLEIGLPMGHLSWDEYWDAYWNRGLGDIIREAYAEHNIKQYPGAAGCYYNFNTNFPVTQLSDLQGKKIRALGVYGKYVQALGGSAVSIPGGELYMAMKLGTIDGAIYDASGLQDVKFHEVVKFYTLPTLAQIAVSMLINKNSLEKLPPDLRVIVDNGTRFILEDTSNRYITATKASLNKSVNMGSVKICYLPEEELVKARKLTLPIWDELAAKSPRMKKGVDILKQQMRDVGRPMD